MPNRQARLLVQSTHVNAVCYLLSTRIQQYLRFRVFYQPKIPSLNRHMLPPYGADWVHAPNFERLARRLRPSTPMRRIPSRSSTSSFTILTFPSRTTIGRGTFRFRRIGVRCRRITALSTPLFIWDPRSGAQNVRRQSLVQTIDLPATLLEYFGLPVPPDMQGVPLRRAIADDTPVREAGLFGVHGAHVNVTDGRYVYMRAPATPDNAPLYEYTHMPTHMKHTFAPKELQKIDLQPPFAFTKGCPTMRIDAHTRAGQCRDPRT